MRTTILLAVPLLLSLCLAGEAHASGAANYSLWCAGCHGSDPSKDKDNITRAATRNNGADAIRLALNTKPEMMNVTVGAMTIRWGLGELATAILTALPVALAYLLFQRKVTEAIMLSAGIKG